MLLPQLRKLTIYGGGGGLGFSALVKYGKARKPHLRPPGQATMVWRSGAGVAQEVESPKELVEVARRVGEAPKSL